MRVAFDLEAFFHSKRAAIIHRWVDLLNTTVGEQYAARPREELQGTVAKAYDAEVDVILKKAPRCFMWVSRTSVCLQ